jgi:phenylpropionate dioxygenase-like ring-hydroxylating dioxygenase large terminal subunit
VGRETIVLVRGRDQAIRGFLNVCRHRGAQLCLTDSGEVGRTIRCPYHAWTYGLDGQLVAAPNWRALDGIDRARYRLHQVHVATWEGLFPAQTLEAGRYDVADAVALFSRVNEQDFAAAQWCQPNMSSRAYARGGVLVPSEAPVISRYYQWYLGLMEEACRSTTG